MSKVTRGRALDAREAALRDLLAIEKDGRFANVAEAGVGMTPAERGLYRELVLGVTRRRGTLDWVLGKLVSRPLDTLDAGLRNILRLGTYQLLYLDRVPDSAAVNEAVEQAKRHGHVGTAKMANAVLRNVIRRKPALEPPTFAADQLGALQHRYSLPAWLASRWLKDYGKDAEALAAWSLQVPGLALRVNTRRTTRDALLAALATAGVEATASDVVPEGIRVGATQDVTTLPGYMAGEFYVQDEAAMLVSRVVDPQPGETVIDVGAAPGGKTTHLAELMGDSGKLWAVEASDSRMGRLEANVRRLGPTIVHPHVADGRDTSAWPDADRILLDVPCSGLGVMPRKPDLRWRQTPETQAELVALQRELLAAAAKKVKPGGRLVYATCTVGRAENQDQVAWFLAEHPDFKAGELTPYIPAAWRADIEGGSMIQLLPHRHGVDGFFIAVMNRA